MNLDDNTKFDVNEFKFQLLNEYSDYLSKLSYNDLRELDYENVFTLLETKVMKQRREKYNKGE